jgi:hypothetical protein
MIVQIIFGETEKWPIRMEASAGTVKRKALNRLDVILALNININ